MTRIVPSPERSVRRLIKIFSIEEASIAEDMAELDRREKEFDIVLDVEPMTMIIKLLVQMSLRMSCSQVVMLVKFSVGQQLIRGLGRGVVFAVV